MDVSLFEQLITNGVRSVVLGVQHRMRPEVARLIVPVVYDQLANHPSVCQYPNVAGMRKNVFFWNHQHDEERESDSSSFFNQHEVESSLALAHYLCQQGIQQEKITILATYSAQLRRMLSHRQTRYNMRSLDRVHLTTVDDYQGEENDVVILSLVRSNRNKVIGFLRIENRVCVALSRARHGLYILGNMNMLSGSSPLWDHVKKTTNEGQEIGMELVLKCDRHQNIIYKVYRFVLGLIPFSFIFCLSVETAGENGQRFPVVRHCLQPDVRPGAAVRPSVSHAVFQSVSTLSVLQRVCFKKLQCHHKCRLP